MQHRQLLGDLFDRTGLTNQQIADWLGAPIHDVEGMRKYHVYPDSPGAVAQIGSLTSIAKTFNIDLAKLQSIVEESEPERG
jgi:hypothetical protein